MVKKHNHLMCTICGTDMEVPMCCSKEMAIVNGELTCKLCGNEEDIPICCGKEVKVVY